jgi:hypothetical protein
LIQWSDKSIVYYNVKDEKTEEIWRFGGKKPK